MTTDNRKHIITNEIVWIRELIFSRVIFLSSSEASVAFNISSSHTNTNLSIRRFSHKHFLMSKYLSILHALLHSKSHCQDFTYNHLYKNPNRLILYTDTNIHHYSIFSLNYINFYLMYIYTHTIDIEQKIFLSTSAFISFTLFGTQIREHGSSIVFQLPPHLLTLTVNG